MLFKVINTNITNCILDNQKDDIKSDWLTATVLPNLIDHIKDNPNYSYIKDSILDLIKMVFEEFSKYGEDLKNHLIKDDIKSYTISRLSFKIDGIITGIIYCKYDKNQLPYYVKEAIDDIISD